MKRFFIATLMALISLSGAAQTQGQDIKKELDELVKSYEKQAGFKAVSAGKFMMSLARAAARSESKEASEAIKNIDNMLIVSFEGMSPENKAAVAAKLEAVLGKTELLMEAQEKEETVRIYGRTHEQKIYDLMIYTPGMYALVCLFGSLDVADMPQVVKEYK